MGEIERKEEKEKEKGKRKKDRERKYFLFIMGVKQENNAKSITVGSITFPLVQKSHSFHFHHYFPLNRHS